MFLCIISQMFAKLKFGKSVNSDIWQTCQIATFTLFPNLSFPNISEMMQTDVPLVIYNTINTCLKHSGWHKMTTYQQLWNFFSMHGKKFPCMEIFFPYMEIFFHLLKFFSMRENFFFMVSQIWRPNRFGYFQGVRNLPQKVPDISLWFFWTPGFAPAIGVVT